MTTAAAVRDLALSLPRAYEALVRGQVKFRVGRIVFAALSRDETIMGIGFPKQFRDQLVAAEPDRFMLPGKADLRYNWVHVRLAAVDDAQMRDLVVDAWAMCVPKAVAASYPVAASRASSRSTTTGA